MPQKSIYNYDYLLSFSEENNITLLDDYSKLKVVKRSTIKSNCIKCNEPYEKSFETMIKYKFFYCINCSKIIKEENNVINFGVKNTLQMKKARDNGKKYMTENNESIQNKKSNQI